MCGVASEYSAAVAFVCSTAKSLHLITLHKSPMDCAPVHAKSKRSAQFQACLQEGLAKVEQGTLDPNEVYAKGRTLLQIALSLGNHRAAHALLNGKRIDPKAHVYREQCVMDLAVGNTPAELVWRIVDMGFPLIGRHCQVDMGQNRLRH